LAERICDFLIQQDYVGGVFVRDDLGDIPGTLPLQDIGLDGGSAKLPKPAIVVNFRGFALDPRNPWSTWVQIADTRLGQGQGQHGGLNRADTFNNIVAVGPDFKENNRDDKPVSNADVAQTIAHILNLDMDGLNPKPSNPPKPNDPKWQGRVLWEALREQSGHDVTFSHEVKRSPTPARNSLITVLHRQKLTDGGTPVSDYFYYDHACLVAVDSNDQNVECEYSEYIHQGLAETRESGRKLGQVGRSAEKLRKVVSGGQTGVDQAGLRAASRASIKTGGWCPPGCKSLDGDVPSVFKLKAVPEERSVQAPEVARSLRTEWNVRDSDATLILALRSVIDDSSVSKDRSL